MNFIKGIRFGLPIIYRVGLIEDRVSRRVTWNQHAGCELHFVLKGSCAWEIEGQRKNLIVRGGHFAIIPGSVRHRAVNEMGEPSVRLGVICEAPTASLAAGSSFRAADFVRIFTQLEKTAFLPRMIPLELMNALRVLREALGEFDVQKDETALRLKVISEFVLLEVARICVTKESVREVGDLVPSLCTWIEKHLGEKITNEELVRISGYGRSQLFRLFYEGTGMTPNDYVIRRRIVKAQKMLKNPECQQLTIEMIGRRCGFNSPSFFASTFSKIVGMKPNEWRQS